MKKILFLATGGTIASRKTAEGLSPQLSAKELLEAVPELKGLCEITAEQHCSIDSTNMTTEIWCSLAKRIQQHYSDYDGFVIAHGTDTLAYGAAAFCCLIQGSEKPIIFTGSQIPLGFDGSDAEDNLLNAFAAACSDIAGVAVVFGGRIIDGRCARKVHTRRPDAFRSIDCDDWGRTENGVVTLNRDFNRSTAPIFFNRLCPMVAVIKLTPEMDASFIQYMSERNRAVIIEGFGLGGFPNYGDEAFEIQMSKLAMDGVQIIMHTQVNEGGTDLSQYAVGNPRIKIYGTSEANGMTTEMAVMKAMWALAYSYSREDFTELFTRKI